MLSEVYKNNRQNGFTVVNNAGIQNTKRHQEKSCENNSFSLYSARIILTVPPYGLQDECL